MSEGPRGAMTVFVFCWGKQVAGKLRIFPSSSSSTRMCRQHAFCLFLRAASSNFLSLPLSRPHPSLRLLRQPGGAASRATVHMGCWEWGPEGGTRQLVLRHPLPAGGWALVHFFLPTPSTRTPPFLPPSPPLSSPTPSPIKRACSALDPCSRRTVRARRSVSLSSTQRPRGKAEGKLNRVH